MKQLNISILVLWNFPLKFINQQKLSAHETEIFEQEHLCFYNINRGNGCFNMDLIYISRKYQISFKVITLGKCKITITTTFIRVYFLKLVFHVLNYPSDKHCHRSRHSSSAFIFNLEQGNRESERVIEISWNLLLLKAPSRITWNKQFYVSLNSQKTFGIKNYSESIGIFIVNCSLMVDLVLNV